MSLRKNKFTKEDKLFMKTTAGLSTFLNKRLRLIDYRQWEEGVELFNAIH